VLVGLAFGVLELPGLAGGVGDLAGQAQFVAEVMHPAGQEAGLEDDGGGALAGGGVAGVLARGGQGGEACLGGSRVGGAGDTLVFAEVEGENGAGGGRGTGRRLHRASSCGARGGWVVW